MILDSEVKKQKRNYDLVQLGHAMRCIFLYMFYAKVQEIHGAVPVPVTRLTPTGTMAYKVTRANNSLKDVGPYCQINVLFVESLVTQLLHRIGEDWVLYADRCMSALATQTSDLGTTATGWRLLYDQFLLRRMMGNRRAAFLDLGIFTAHVSLLIQQVSRSPPSSNPLLR